MIRTIIKKDSKVATIETRGYISRIQTTQSQFKYTDLRKVDIEVKRILEKNSWVVVAPKALTQWQS